MVWFPTPCHCLKNKYTLATICMILLCVCSVFTAGCMQGKPSQTSVQSPTPATPITSTRSLPLSLNLDPIVGSWKTSGTIYTTTIIFDVYGKTRQTFSDQPNVQFNGTWQVTGPNTYLVTQDNGQKSVWIFSPNSNIIFKQIAPQLTYSLYQGTDRTSQAVFSGVGDTIIPFTATESGMWAFTMNYTGQTNYIIWLTDDIGRRVALLANSVNSTTSIKTENLGLGKYYLDITAGGAWTIQVSPI